MMISPETFYEMRLKGKNEAEIMSVIRSLKHEIGRLKNIVEHPDYASREVAMFPSETTRISCSRFYLERAIQALKEAGGKYVPSIAEQKAMEFESNIPYISKITFYIGGFLDGYNTRTYIIDKNMVRMTKAFSYVPEADTIGQGKVERIYKQWFLEGIKDLRIGEWRRKYDCRQFGCFVMDGTQWELEFHFSNGHKPVKICGDNAYPYNFDHLLDLLGIEE